MSEVEVLSKALHADKVELADVADDLEDGEIDDDGEDDDLMITGVTIASPPSKNNSPIVLSPLTDKKTNAHKQNNEKSKIETIDLVGDTTPASLAVPAPIKLKKPQPIEDDHASSIEYAIANALKKKGIEPPLPKLLEPRNGLLDAKDSDILAGHGQSKSSRRRKRKKQRDEKDKDKERKEKKKQRFESPPEPAPELDEDFDEYEMLNVRGGSPPPISHPPLLPVNVYKDEHYESEDSYTSYDSFESGDNSDVETGNRRRRRGKKDSRKRREDRNNRQDKRKRHDSPEDGRRQEPRKLELCKFYLMECCAKKDKCSYMHSEFPCKYYYLGMDCPNIETCKFAHSEPLSEQLRGILLKHIETAPKEILGKFKRLTRENAVVQMNKRHEELCKQYNVENTWSITTQHINYNRKTEQQKQQPTLKATPNIPSLLDMVIIKPDIEDMDLGNGSNSLNPAQTKGDKRKTRWLETNSSSNNQRSNLVNSESIANNGPSYLDIKNLKNVLSDEHISKLSQFNITNLEQINQLTVGQLNQIGLTAAEISDIQVNALKMAKSDSKPTEESKTEQKNSTDDNSTKQDVDMRFLPSTVSLGNEVQNKDEILKEDSASNSNSSNIVVVDYSQYLKDSNLGFDRSGSCDDERDDEQLIIDDINLEHDDGEEKTFKMDETKQKLPKLTNIEKSLKNPFSSIYKPISEAMKDPRSKINTDSVQYNKFENTPSPRHDSDDEILFASLSRRSRSNTPRSGTATPEASQSPKLDEDNGLPKYERATIYDLSPEEAAREEESALNMKSDKDMRFIQNSSGLVDIDFRLPFQPVANFTPATEIDASYSSHLPILYKIIKIDLSRPNYTELRKSSKSDQTNDPRLRRILGLPELSGTKRTETLIRKSVKVSNTIASPESSDGASPKYYIPPKTSSKHQSHESTSYTSKRIDPRRMAAETVTNKNRASTPPIATNNSPSQSNTTNSAIQLQNFNIELRNLAHKSDWYRSLNSKFKIMANQQLALVATELKKFHQDENPNKIFDITFILNSSTLQEILTNIGIYIDDNGEILSDADNDNEIQSNVEGGSSTTILPNFSQPPPTQQQMDFLNSPPPNMLGPHMSDNNPMAQQIFRPGIPVPPPMNMPPFGPNGRPSLLGMPPGGTNNPFHQFPGIVPDLGINPNFSGGPGLLGPLPVGNFNNFGPGGLLNNMHQQRNFNGNAGNRNNRNRRKI
ncbi:protein suppressor of sable isoform X2 [Teleopsis dalmanni]|uniref:protein suppressor of sable isoform X2 n=1 Tax=Teleopsis dalmanni TaxID=139649 RepID=UPI0018CDD0DC|nr:protein suppressor of sable isoform X2 [Teleopsis dalmanni]